MRRLARGLSLFLMLLAGGCMTTHHVARPDNPATFQALAFYQGAPISVIYPAAKATPLWKDDPSADAQQRWLQDRRPRVGTAQSELVTVTPEGPVVASVAGPVQLKLEDVRGYQIRRGGLGALEGLSIGVLTGVVLGTAIGFSEGDDPPCMSTEPFGCLFYLQETAGQKAALGGVLMGVTGALLGTIIGALVGHTDEYVF